MSIVLQDVTVRFDRPVLEHFSLELPEQGIVCLMGASGCGKTTLMRVLAGMQPIQGGTITGLQGKRIAVLFQEDRLFPWLNAEQNIQVVCPDADGSKWLERVGLADAWHKFPGEMSGGMQRRVALARTLAYGGDVTLLDEPFKGLDANTKAVMIQLVKQCAGFVLVITHDAEDVDALGAQPLLCTGPPIRCSF